MVRRVFTLVFLSLASFLLVNAQRSKVIAAFQLIETEKYTDAKKLLEEALEDQKTKLWYRTWHAKGLLAQKAYDAGKKANAKDRDKFELYPDQLYVAIAAYQKAQELDKKGRINSQLAPMYVNLANEFQKIGQNDFNNQKYPQSLKAFETALMIIGNPALTVETDTNLIYNTALAAYESREWEKAIKYLEILNENLYSTNIPILLHNVYMEQQDTTMAQKVLVEGIENYENNEDLVLLLADFFILSNEDEKAFAVLDTASGKHPMNYIFPYTRGLIHQKNEQYADAIEAYKKAHTLANDEVKILVNIGTCYFNRGVEIEEHARTIVSNNSYRNEKAKAMEAYNSSVTWFEKAYKLNPENKNLAEKLYDLYKVLGVNEKIKELNP